MRDSLLRSKKAKSAKIEATDNFPPNDPVTDCQSFWTAFKNEYNLSDLFFPSFQLRSIIINQIAIATSSNGSY